MKRGMFCPEFNNLLKGEGSMNMKHLSHKLYSSVTLLSLAALLSGCCCNRGPQLEEEELETNIELNTVDPQISKGVNLKREEAAPEEANKAKTAPAKKATPIPYEKYPISSYTDLPFTKYDSGLKVQILKEGPASGESPKRGQTVVTHYNSWHSKKGKPGREVDSTYDRGEPFEFKIGYGYVIRGIDEAVMDMKPGDKRRIFIPSEMAFGQAGATDLVPGDTDLIYEVEVVDIK